MSPARATQLSVTPPWRKVMKVPRKGAAELAVSEETAPGRTDHPNHVIAGYCPPKARLYELGKGRAIVTREPCSGTTEMTIRTAGVEKRVAGVNLYGVTGTWHAKRLDVRTVLMISTGQVTSLLLVDLASANAYFLRMPRELERSSGVTVTVADGTIFLSGGMVEVVVGSGGCDNPPPGQGCDPYTITRKQPNKQAWAIRPS